jgi:hypothetical protein
MKCGHVTGKKREKPDSGRWYAPHAAAILAQLAAPPTSPPTHGPRTAKPKGVTRGGGTTREEDAWLMIGH